MTNVPSEIESPSTPWMRKVQRLIAMGQKSRALEIIERVIDYDMPLFRNEFLVHLNDCWRSKTLVIAATNLIEKLDPAILRPGRFDKKIFIGPPDLKARVGLLKLFMAERPQEKINWLDVAEKCEFYTCAEIEHLVNEAARSAVKEPRSITEADILKAIEMNPPAFDSQRIEKMKAHIGFV